MKVTLNRLDVLFFTGSLKLAKSNQTHQKTWGTTCLLLLWWVVVWAATELSKIFHEIKLGKKHEISRTFFQREKLKSFLTEKKFLQTYWGFQKYISCNPWAKRIFNLCPTHGTIWPWCPDRSCKTYQVLENTVRGTLWDHWGLSSFNIVLVRSLGR